MLIVFKSKASADVIMFGDVAEQMLHVMGKQASREGIITVDQLPAAIERLKRAALHDKLEQVRAEAPTHERAPGGGRREYVSLAVRAVPLLELLEHSLRAKQPVLWGG